MRYQIEGRDVGYQRGWAPEDMRRLLAAHEASEQRRANPTWLDRVVAVVGRLMTRRELA